MSKMGFSTFHDGYQSTNYVAPKSEYSKEEFESECAHEGWYKHGETKEGFCRWYPVAPEGCDIEGGCYSFCKEGKGAFPVWYNEITGKVEGESV